MSLGRRLGVTAAASVLVAVPALAGTAGTANAFTGTVSGGCWIDGISSSIAPWTTTQTLKINGSTSAATVTEGSQLTLSYGYALGPNNGGPDLDTATVQVFAQMSVYSGATRTATVVATSPVDPGVLNGEPFPGQTLPNATLTAPAAGSYDVKVDWVTFKAVGGAAASGLNVVCSGNSANTPAPIPGSPAATLPNEIASATGKNVKQRTLNFALDPSSEFAATGLTAQADQGAQPPGSPTGVTAVAGDAQLTASWTAPSSGGAPTSYVATASGGKTCTTATTSCTITGLTNGTAYTVTVVAKNSGGDSAPSSPSSAVTPTAPTAPAAPTAVSATAGDASAAVTWTAPSDNGGSAITGYTVTSDPDAKTCTTATTSCTVSGLTNGTAYTFNVTATNAAGTSAASTPSAAVTPTAAAPSPTPSSSATPVVVNGMICEILTSIAAWEKASPNGDVGDSPPPSLTFSASSLSVKAGDKVSLLLSFSQGPQSGPVELNAGVLQPKAKIKVGGAGSGTVIVTGAKYGKIAPYTFIPGTTLSGTYTATTAGTVNFTLEEFGFDYGDTEAGAAFTWPTKVEQLDTICNKGTKPKTAPVSIGLVAQEGGSAIPELPSTPPTSNGALTVTGSTVAGGTVTLSGSGFKPGTPAVAGIYSTPEQLGVATASSTGDVSLSVVIPASLTGQHTLVLLGTKADGSPWALTKTVTVTASGGGDGGGDGSDDGDNGSDLASTGPEDFAKTLLIALVALQVGLIAAVRGARRRRPVVAARHRR